MTGHCTWGWMLKRVDTRDFHWTLIMKSVQRMVFWGVHPTILRAEHHMDTFFESVQVMLSAPCVRWMPSGHPLVISQWETSAGCREFPGMHPVSTDKGDVRGRMRKKNLPLTPVELGNYIQNVTDRWKMSDRLEAHDKEKKTRKEKTSTYTLLHDQPPSDKWTTHSTQWPPIS